jgi:hypothetical protein
MAHVSRWAACRPASEGPGLLLPRKQHFTATARAIYTPASTADRSRYIENTDGVVDSMVSSN